VIVELYVLAILLTFFGELFLLLQESFEMFGLIYISPTMRRISNSMEIT
jgi:hypothetical protein